MSCVGGASCSSITCWHVILATSTVSFACIGGTYTNINNALVRSSRSFNVTSIASWLAHENNFLSQKSKRSSTGLSYRCEPRSSVAGPKPARCSLRKVGDWGAADAVGRRDVSNHVSAALIFTVSFFLDNEQIRTDPLHLPILRS